MIKFTYTKDNGETSVRKGILLTSAQKNHAILDLSDYSGAELDQIKEDYKAYEEEFKQMKRELQDKYGLTEVFARFKAFKPDNISNVESI